MRRIIAAVVSLLIVGQLADATGATKSILLLSPFSQNEPSVAALTIEKLTAEFNRRDPNAAIALAQPTRDSDQNGLVLDDVLPRLVANAPVNRHQLRRWGISEGRLQPRTVIRDRVPSAWETYRWYIVWVVAVVALQMALIVWLLVEYRRRRRTEVEVGERLQEARAQLATITRLDWGAAIGEVTTAITHELNQPLAAILHNAEAGELMLQSGVTSVEEVRQIFADIRRIDLRAAQTIGRLRALLQRKEFEKGPVDVNELIRETAALLTPVAGSKGVRVELDLAMDGVPILGDRMHLQQALLNVVLNGVEAMSATPRGQRRLTIRTAKSDDHVEIAVVDCGHGISAEAVSQIFEPFFTTKGQGMGIGLSIGRTIVEAHGGRIDARNNPNGGATVWFTIPSGQAAPLPTDTPHSLLPPFTSA